MQLTNLPNELIELIAQNLDIASSINFGRTQRRIREVCYYMPKFIKETELSERTIEYSSRHGASVRSVDLSNCDPNVERVRRIVQSCPLATELKVVNSGLTYEELLEALEPLKELRALSFTLWSSEDVELSESQIEQFKNVHKLYVEMTPSRSTLPLVIELMDACPKLEVCHINLTGEGEYFDETDKPRFSLDEERWQSLRTFVCTNYQSRNGRACEFLLRCVFAENPPISFEDWMQRVDNCYIYEHGIFNGLPVARPEANIQGDVKLLKRYHQIELPSKLTNEILENDSYLFEAPHGSPRSVRVVDPSNAPFIGYHYDLNKCLTQSLLELDFTGCHGKAIRNFNVTKLAPYLETLAIPLCFFLIRHEPNIDPTRFANFFVSQFSEMGLKKLIVNANRHRRGCNGVDCDCNEDEEACGCHLCNKSLTSRNIPKLSELRHLEEMTFENVHLQDSAYKKLVSPTVHTVRLSLRKESSFKSFGKFLKRCPQLKSLKVDSQELPMDSQDLWTGLAGGPKFETLCLGTHSERFYEIHELSLYVRTIFARTKVLHLHNMQVNFGYFLVDLCPQMRLYEESDNTVLVRQTSAFGREPNCQPPAASFPGRSSCCMESFVGFVKPEAL